MGCSLSAGVTIYSATDDFVSGYLIGATMPAKCRNVFAAPVVMEDHVAVGCNSVILPGLTLGRGCAVGALSLVKCNVRPYHIVAGPKQKIVGKRSSVIIDKMERMLESC